MLVKTTSSHNSSDVSMCVCVRVVLQTYQRGDSRVTASAMWDRQ